ncbi:MAG: glycoside hydrolase family 88 protein [Verrucomicrobiota bacterium]|jgi:rhamnogalacturonyl hydrolase YesR
MKINPICAGIMWSGAVWWCAGPAAQAQPGASADHGVDFVRRLQPDYPIPYAPASVAQITAVLGRVADYLDTASPIQVMNAETQERVSDLTRLPKRVTIAPGDFLLVSYEWGVTYAGMLQAGEATGDARFKEYAAKRLEALRLIAEHIQATPAAERGQPNPLQHLLQPAALDDCGAMSAAFLKAQQAGVGGDFRPLIDIGLNYISSKQKRLPDGTLARDRPMPDSVWLDDDYMSVPALAQMGRLTGQRKYFDDAAKQVLHFSKILFVKEKGLYIHGLAEGMQQHPHFYWGRANGWAAMAEVELLSVLPKNHPGFAPALALLREHIRGLQEAQGKNGLWHQLLDRPETYEETSASAMFVFAAARAINRGWIDGNAYGPMVSLGWNALAQKVNARGQVEGTCIGTGLAWDPMWYASRPTSVYAAHGYGPVLMAGAEMIQLRRGLGAGAGFHDDAVHFGRPTPAAPVK